MRQIKITSAITNRESPAMDKYLQEISRLELLTPEQEVELARRIRQGDQDALEELTKANLRFVVSVAKQYQNQGLSLNDLINEGNMGLIKAAQRFDETKGFKFISYAVWWIRQSIIQAIMQNARMVRLPLNKLDNHARITKMHARFIQEFERAPSDEELADLTGLPLKEVEELMKIGAKHISIDAPIDGSDENSDAFVDNLGDDNSTPPDKSLMSESLKNEIHKALCNLSKREADIIEHYFGLNDINALSLEDIADKFGLTRERVRQLKERAIRRLRKVSRSTSLKSYLG